VNASVGLVRCPISNSLVLARFYQRE